MPVPGLICRSRKPQRLLEAEVNPTGLLEPDTNSARPPTLSLALTYGRTRKSETMYNLYRKSESIVFRRIGDEFILAPIKRRAGEIEKLYRLGGIAAEVWDMLDEERSFDRILDRIVAEFDTDREQAQLDLESFLNRLREIGAIEGE